MRIRFALLIVLCCIPLAGQAALKPIARDPYVGAIVIDQATGKVVFEDNADAPLYPASVLKIMNLLLIVELVEQQKADLEDVVTVTAEAARIGGSQVYLKENEQFRLDDMLYAMMIQSANDVAVALAVHYAGSKDAWLKLMNQKASQLGMNSTVFRSVHGLPPGKDQKPDVTTARDMARLGLEVARHPLALKYTSAQEKGFRGDSFIMRTHNNLLGTVSGCDGLKTGYIRAAGFSMVATVERDGRRIVAAVFGSETKNGRDSKTKELIERAYLNLPVIEEPVPVTEEPDAAESAEVEDGAGGRGRGVVIKALLAAGAVALLMVVSRSVMRKKFDKYGF